MDQKNLTSFLVLAEELQFGRAAIRLGITQSALSQQIARLEKTLGVVLFERTKRRVQLSECGHLFVPEAQKVIATIECATDTVQRAAKGLLGKITLAYVDAAPFSLLSSVIVAFSQAYPGIELVLHEMTSSEQFEALSDGRIDAGLLRPLYPVEGISMATLLKEPYVVAMHKGHALSELEAIPVHALINEKFLYTSKEKARYIHDRWLPLFSRHGIFPTVVQEVNQLHAMLSLIGASMGMALIPLSVAKNNNHGVVYRPVSDEDSPCAELNIGWHHDRSNQLVNHFVRIAKQVAQYSQNRGW